MLTLDLQEAVRLSSKSGGTFGFETLDTSGHWLALEELSQRMLQKVSFPVFSLIQEPSLLTSLVSRIGGLENTISGILVTRPHIIAYNSDESREAAATNS
jgi:hypothetical protein